MKRMFTAFTLCVVTILFIPQLALAANDKAFFWELKTDKAKVYLFGSIHLADSSFYPLRDEIETAFAESQALAVEADIFNADLVEETRLLFKYGVYPAGEKLTDHISDDTYQQLRAALKPYELQIPLNYAIKFRPGTLMITLGQLLAEESGLDFQYGLDMHFLKQASTEGKEIIELEGSEQLMQVLAQLGPAEAVIQATINQLDETDALLQQMIDVWKSGDHDAMTQLAIDSQIDGTEGAKDMMDILLFDRNRGMADKIEGFIERGGTYFVVVGAAHLVGDQGVPALLEQSGYEVLRR